MTRPAPDRGVVLVTILVVMALCVTVIVLMTTASERATLTTADDFDAAQARALLTAGEASALSALLRDLDNPPEADGLSEAWAQLAQTDIAIQGGTFRLAITDRAARFNLNTLTLASPWSRQALTQITAAAGLKPEVAARIAAALQGGKPLLHLSDLASRAGLTQAELAALNPLVTCTPDLNGGVNINTAPKPLLLALLPDKSTADRILTDRDDHLITSAMLETAGILLPDGLSLTSQVFDLSISVTSGSAHLAAISTVHRWRDSKGRAHAVISARSLGSS